MVKGLKVIVILVLAVAGILGLFHYFQWWGIFLPKAKVTVIEQNVDHFDFNPKTNKVIYSVYENTAFQSIKKGVFIYDLTTGEKTKAQIPTEFTYRINDPLITTIAGDFAIVNSKNDGYFIINDDYTARLISDTTSVDIENITVKNSNFSKHYHQLWGFTGRTVYADAKQLFTVMEEPVWTSTYKVKLFFNNKYLEFDDTSFNTDSSGYYRTKNGELMIIMKHDLVLIR